MDYTWPSDSDNDEEGKSVAERLEDAVGEQSSAPSFSQSSEIDMSSPDLQEVDSKTPQTDKELPEIDKKSDQKLKSIIRNGVHDVRELLASQEDPDEEEEEGYSEISLKLEVERRVNILSPIAKPKDFCFDKRNKCLVRIIRDHRELLDKSVKIPDESNTTAQLVVESIPMRGKAEWLQYRIPRSDRIPFYGKGAKGSRVWDPDQSAKCLANAIAKEERLKGGKTREEVTKWFTKGVEFGQLYLDKSFELEEAENERNKRIAMFAAINTEPEDIANEDSDDQKDEEEVPILTQQDNVCVNKRATRDTNRSENSENTTIAPGDRLVLTSCMSAPEAVTVQQVFKITKDGAKTVLKFVGEQTPMSMNRSANYKIKVAEKWVKGKKRQGVDIPGTYRKTQGAKSLKLAEFHLKIGKEEPENLADKGIDQRSRRLNNSIKAMDSMTIAECEAKGAAIQAQKADSRRIAIQNGEDVSSDEDEEEERTAWYNQEHKSTYIPDIDEESTSVPGLHTTSDASGGSSMRDAGHNGEDEADIYTQEEIDVVSVPEQNAAHETTGGGSMGDVENDKEGDGDNAVESVSEPPADDKAHISEDTAPHVDEGANSMAPPANQIEDINNRGENAPEPKVTRKASKRQQPAASKEVRTRGGGKSRASIEVAEPSSDPQSETVDTPVDSTAPADSDRLEEEQSVESVAESTILNKGRKRKQAVEGDAKTGASEHATDHKDDAHVENPADSIVAMQGVSVPEPPVSKEADKPKRGRGRPPKGSRAGVAKACADGTVDASDNMDEVDSAGLDRPKLAAKRGRGRPKVVKPSVDESVVSSEPTADAQALDAIDTLVSSTAPAAGNDIEEGKNVESVPKPTAAMKVDRRKKAAKIVELASSHTEDGKNIEESVSKPATTKKSRASKQADEKVDTPTHSADQADVGAHSIEPASSVEVLPVSIEAKGGSKRKRAEKTSADEGVDTAEHIAEHMDLDAVVDQTETPSSSIAPADSSIEDTARDVASAPEPVKEKKVSKRMQAMADLPKRAGSRRGSTGVAEPSAVDTSSGDTAEHIHDIEVQEKVDTHVDSSVAPAGSSTEDSRVEEEIEHAHEPSVTKTDKRKRAQGEDRKGKGKKGSRAQAVEPSVEEESEKIDAPVNRVAPAVSIDDSHKNRAAKRRVAESSVEEVSETSEHAAERMDVGTPAAEKVDSHADSVAPVGTCDKDATQPVVAKKRGRTPKQADDKIPVNISETVVTSADSSMAPIASCNTGADREEEQETQPVKAKRGRKAEQAVKPCGDEAVLASVVTADAQIPESIVTSANNTVPVDGVAKKKRNRKTQEGMLLENHERMGAPFQAERSSRTNARV